MAVSNYGELSAHFGHDLEVAKYSDQNVAVECLNCFEVIVDFDREGN